MASISEVHPLIPVLEPVQKTHVMTRSKKISYGVVETVGNCFKRLSLGGVTSGVFWALQLGGEYYGEAGNFFSKWVSGSYLKNYFTHVGSCPYTRANFTELLKQFQSTSLFNS